VGYQPEWYWDGRAKTLEAQAAAAWTKVNMGASKPEEITAKLNAIPGYKKQFQKVFAQDATPDNVPKALACYMRTIISQTTPHDKGAASDAAKRGLEVFKRAKCDNCHSGVFFADNQYHNVGIGMKAATPDLGRFVVSKADKDKGAFKTPTLRDVARSAPYFHDGSAATLEEAVKIMAGGGIENEWLDKVNVVKTELTPAEFSDLIEFLKSLTETAELKAPKLP
jgi:cytochrome c peroxidase